MGESIIARQLDDQNARFKLERITKSWAAEEEGTAGPSCFGPCVLKEPFHKGFTFSHDTPKYNGSTMPQDWLTDYTTAFGIVGGNKRVAVRYAPLMLLGLARTWLNSLPSAA